MLETVYVRPLYGACLIPSIMAHAPPLSRPSTPLPQAEFISKIIPDPIEHGVVDALRKVVAPMTKALGG